MAKDDIREKNLEAYEGIYKNSKTKLAYEIKDKVLIFNSLKCYLGKVKEKKVLDIGFGTGDILLSLARDGADCFGVEIVQPPIENLKNFSPYNFHLSKREGDYLPFKNGFFDIVICSHVLEHLKDDKKELGEISRVLKKNGLVVLGVPGEGIGHHFLHYREYTVDNLLKIIESWQIIILKKYGSGVFQKIMSLIKKIASFISDDFKKIDSNRKKKNGQGDVSLVNKVYYNLGVPFLLFLLFIDNLLPFSKSSPIEIWTVLKKPNEKHAKKYF